MSWFLWANRKLISPCLFSCSAPFALSCRRADYAILTSCSRNQSVVVVRSLWFLTLTSQWLPHCCCVLPAIDFHCSHVLFGTDLHYSVSVLLQPTFETFLQCITELHCCSRHCKDVHQKKTHLGPAPNICFAGHTPPEALRGYDQLAKNKILFSCYWPLWISEWGPL